MASIALCITACYACRVTADTAHGRGSSVYCGFDPTAPDLHIGNLLAILGLAHFQLEGYQPVAVVRLGRDRRVVTGCIV